MFRFLPAIILIICSIIPSFASQYKESNAKFKAHYSFYNLPMRVMDTKDRVYFFVRQRYYHPTARTGWYSEPAGAIFYIDKQKPEEEMKKLHMDVTLSGTRIYLCDADAQTGVVVIGYDDTGVDLIFPDGQLIYIDNLKSRFSTTGNVINSIDIDPGTHDIYVSSNNGYLKISGITGKVLIDSRWTRNETVKSMNRVGDKIIAIINGNYYEAPAENKAAINRASFTRIQNESFASNPIKILPLSDTQFAYVTSGGNAGEATFTNSAWKWENKATVSGIAAGSPYFNECERTAVHTADGYLLASANAILKIIRPNADNATAKWEQIPLASDRTPYAATFDGKSYWFYRTPGYFVNCTLSEGKWAQTGQPLRPNAPFSCGPMLFDYSSTQGFIAVNSRTGMIQTDYHSTFSPALLQSYRNGTWIDLSTVFEMPEYVENNAELKASYNSYRYTNFPGEDPQGMFVDPCFPDIVHFGTHYRGLVSYNIADPKTKNPIWLTTPTALIKGASDYTKTELFPTTSAIANTVCLGFDGDDNLWVLQVGQGTNSNNDLHFFYMTPDERKGMLETGDASQSPAWHKVQVPFKLDQAYRCAGIALRHPKNKNKLLIGSYTYLYEGTPQVFVVDHHGNPDNPTAYTINNFSNILLDNAISKSAYIPEVYLENPITGEIVILSKFGTFIVDDINKPIINSAIPGRKLTFKDADGNCAEIPENLQATTAVFDEYNRLWVGYDDGGVYGIDMQSGKLVGHFTLQNSPMPVNNVLGLGWNPETKSLFVSTMDGMVEIDVDAPVSVDTNISAPYLSHNHVNTDFAGTVAVRNVSAGTMLNVADWQGKTIAILPLPTHGVTYWDLTDNYGNRVAPGKYTITDNSTAQEMAPLQLTVGR